MLKLIIKRFFQGVGILFILALLYFSPNIYHIYKWNPVFTPLSAKFYGEAETVAEARLDDLDFLRKLPTIDRSFTPETLALFERDVSALEARAASLTDAEFALGVARAVAQADNGHTNIGQRDLITKNNRLPFRFYWFDGHLHVVRAAPGHEALLGAEVLAFGDTPVGAAHRTANSYFGGQDNWRSYMSTAILESPALLHAAGITGAADSTSLTLRLEGGTSLTESFDALPAMPEVSFRGLFPWMVLTARPLPGDDGTWSTLAARWTEPPTYLANPDTPYFFEERQNGATLYVNVSFMLDAGGLSIGTFWQNLESHIAGRRYDTIILDLRNNPGGDFNTSVASVARLPDHLTDGGTFYIATNGATFSAAIVNTSVAKFHGGDKAHIIGTRVGDRDQFWAEGGFPFDLPHSDYRVSFATGYHDWVNGCMDRHPLCYDGNEGVENPIASLDPDIRVPLTFADYAAGTDPVLKLIGTKQK
ncbi:hypothetical protein [Kordiimonas lacus]|nr:hypothetical protein [Kordiimonas lacus]